MCLLLLGSGLYAQEETVDGRTKWNAAIITLDGDESIETPVGEDGNIRFKGYFGVADTDLTIDLDGAGPTLYSSEDTTIYINDILDLKTHKISNVVDPTSAQDAATKQYVDDNVGGGTTQEQVDDWIDALINDTDSVHTRITVTYDDTDNAMDLVVDDMLNTITCPDTEVTEGTAITFADTGIMTITESADTITFDATEAQTLSDVCTLGATYTGDITITGTVITSVGLDAIGAVDMDYGSVDVTDHTFITNGTGDAEIVLPDDSIGPAEMAVGAYDLGTSLEADTLTEGGNVVFNTTEIATFTGLTSSGIVNIDDGVGDSPSLFFFDADNKYFALIKYDSGAAGLFNNEGVISLAASNDTNDYLEVSTAAGIVTIATIAGDDGDLVLTAGGGDISTASTFEAATITESGNAVYNSTDDLWFKLGGDVASAGTYNFGSANVVLEIPNAAAPTTNATGEMAIDTDLITQGMLQIYLTSAIANIVATTDTPGDNEVPTYDSAGGTIQWEAAAGGTSEINELLKPQSAKLPSSNPAVIDAGDNNWRLLFDDTTDESCVWSFILDDDYDASTLYADIHYSMTGANTSDKVCWEVYVMSYTPGDSADIGTDSYDTVNYHEDVCSDTAGYMITDTITLTNDDSLAAGDYIRMKIARDAGSSGAGTDDAVGDAELISVVIRQ